MKLQDWYQYHHSDDDCTKLFMAMDYSMHNIHNNGYYIRSFNTRAIEVVEKNNGDKIINYNYLAELEDNIATNINNNIYAAATLQLALYMGVEPENLNSDYIKSNFSQFEIFIPNNLVNYYRRILVNGAHLYLNDYLKAKNEQEIQKLEKELQDDVAKKNSSNGSGRGNSLVKRTGKYSDEVKDNFKEDNSIAAFATNYLLAFVIISVSLLIPLLVLVLGHR
ncbi:MAG TPA: hypothetical protein IAB45_04090 [Candidatus Onthousia faecavium]|nr:hypothetical protein [Candidatus Onthousia faecavium]